MIKALGQQDNAIIYLTSPFFCVHCSCTLASTNINENMWKLKLALNRFIIYLLAPED